MINVNECVEAGRVHQFYTSAEWLRLREKVLKEYNYECQKCKERGKYTRAVIVHHVNHLRARPDLALTELYIDERGEEQRQLVALCKSCHEEEHPESFNRPKIKKDFPPERW